MRLEFLKMQGLGNDFLVFDAPPDARHAVDSNTLRALADRHRGIGFDQALMLEAPRKAPHRVFYRVFNSDGGEVEQCGNGARCVAALMYARQPELGRELTLESAGGLVHARVREDGLVSVDMGIPNFDPRSLHMGRPALGAPGIGAPGTGGPTLGTTGTRTARPASGATGIEGLSSGEPGEVSPPEMPVYSLEIDGANVEFGAVSMGNPHVVLLVPDVKAAPVERFGPTIESHRLFAKRTNVGFMQIVDRQHIRLRVYERGVGETQACGTGACAAVAIGAKRGHLDAEVRVDLPGGTATVAWPGPGRSLWLTGPASTVFTGSIEI